MSGVKFETLVAPVCATVRDPRTKIGLNQDKEKMKISDRIETGPKIFENLGPIRTDCSPYLAVRGSLFDRKTKNWIICDLSLHLPRRKWK